MKQAKPISITKQKCRECDGNALQREIIRGADIYGKEDCRECKGTGQQKIEIYDLRDFEKIKLEEGNLKIGKGDKVFVQEALGKGEEHTRLFLSDELREKIKDIVSEEGFSSTIVLNQEELESKVDFIMSDICDVILEKKYKLIGTGYKIPKESEPYEIKKVSEINCRYNMKLFCSREDCIECEIRSQLEGEHNLKKDDKVVMREV